MSTVEHQGLDSLAGLLLTRSRKEGDRFHEGMAHFYLSAYQDGLHDTVKAAKLRHLDEAERIGLEVKNDTLLTYVYNQKGVWEIYAMRPITAQYWFLRSVQQAAKLPFRFRVPSQSNLSEAYRITGDTLGIKYDREMLEFAAETGSPILCFSAGMHCAFYYARTAPDTATLRPYIEQVRTMEKQYPGIDKYIYAYFYYLRGDYPTAERLIEQVGPGTSDVVVLHAQILNRLGRYADSQRILAPVDSTEGILYDYTRADYLRLKAANSRGLGNLEQAYRDMEAFEAFRDSLQQARNADLTQRARVEFDVLSKERQIEEQRARIRNISILTGAIVLVLLVVIASFIIWQRSRNRFYKEIVRQNREFLRREKALEAAKPEPESPAPAPEADAPAAPETEPEARSGISAEKAAEIWTAIRRLMEREQLWKDPNLSRESMAAKVGCNRTYFSQVIKEKTGMNFSQYVNSCRIREAVRQLSDADNDTPLKDLAESLGFLTIQTFYTAFKKEIGMSPAAYRKTARDL